MTDANINFSLKIVYMNICSLRNKLQEVEVIMRKSNCDILILNEIWITTSESMFFNIPNYVPVFNCRDNREGGGSAIYIKSSIKFNVVNLPKDFYCICLDLYCDNKQIKIATAYRVPDSNPTCFIDFIEEHLCRLNNLVFFGDVNIDILSSNSTTSS